MKNRCKKLEVFQVALGIDFWSIFDGFLLQVGRQNRVKLDIKWCWKNDEKMMMAWMALRWHLGAHECDRTGDSRAPGRSPPLLYGAYPHPSKTTDSWSPLCIEKGLWKPSRQFSGFWRHSRIKHLFLWFRRVEFSSPDPRGKSVFFVFFRL